MSRFQELCAVIEKDRRRWIDYHKQCLGFSKELVNGLREYLQCPDGCLHCVPTAGERDPDKIYSLAGAMRLNDDPFYHFGVILALDVYSPNILVPFLVRKVNDTFEVRIENVDQEFKIREDRLDELEAVYQFVFQLIKETFELGFQRWLEQDKQSERPPLGFYRPLPPEEQSP